MLALRPEKTLLVSLLITLIYYIRVELPARHDLLGSVASASFPCFLIDLFSLFTSPFHRLLSG